jgi:hypothetical protein
MAVFCGQSNDTSSFPQAGLPRPEEQYIIKKFLNMNLFNTSAIELAGRHDNFKLALKYKN